MVGPLDTLLSLIGMGGARSDTPPPALPANIGPQPLNLGDPGKAEALALSRRPPNAEEGQMLRTVFPNLDPNAVRFGYSSFGGNSLAMRQVLKHTDPTTVRTNPALAPQSAQPTKVHETTHIVQEQFPGRWPIANAMGDPGAYNYGGAQGLRRRLDAGGDILKDLGNEQMAAVIEDAYTAWRTNDPDYEKVYWPFVKALQDLHIPKQQPSGKEAFLDSLQAAATQGDAAAADRLARSKAGAFYESLKP